MSKLPAPPPSELVHLRELNAELLAALKELRVTLLSERVGEDYLAPSSIRTARETVRAAIAKAEGK